MGQQVSTEYLHFCCHLKEVVTVSRELNMNGAVNEDICCLADIHNNSIMRHFMY